MIDKFSSLRINRGVNDLYHIKGMHLSKNGQNAYHKAL